MQLPDTDRHLSALQSTPADARNPLISPKRKFRRQLSVRMSLAELDVDWIYPWIGLDWTGRGDCDPVFN